MDKKLISDFSGRLKDIARDLSFLGHPRYPVRELLMLFPEHKSFIAELEDQSIPFKVNVAEKRKAIESFLTDLANSDLGPVMKRIFTSRVQDYHHLLCMMEHFGTAFFYDHCIKLYGSSHQLSPKSAFPYFLERIPEFCVAEQQEPFHQGEAALSYLREKMLETFPAHEFEVKASSSLLSDSSAGRKTLKLNPHKSHSLSQLDIFLVHEGWVHLGTSLNGALQENHPWLATWAPRTTFLQEGLAILTELISGHMTHERWHKVVLRHLAATMAERGSAITDVYAYLRHHQMESLDAFKLSLRVFRGVPLEGGMAFTKELLYLHGLIELLNHLHFFKLDLSTLWIGKMSFEEHILILDNWEKFKPKIHYFPQELKSAEVQRRIKELTDLSFSLFNHGFL
jgi:uncharacterized protein (TIGR02421 family)